MEGMGSRGRWGLPTDRVAAGVHPWRCNGSFSASCIKGNLSLTWDRVRRAARPDRQVVDA